MIFAPCRCAYSIVGRAARRRLSSRTCSPSRGTLKSTLSKSRLSARGKSRMVSKEAMTHKLAQLYLQGKIKEPLATVSRRRFLSHFGQIRSFLQTPYPKGYVGLQK